MKTVSAVALVSIFFSALSAAPASAASPASTEVSVAVKGLHASTEIRVDRWGVPHIYASTLHDAFFAQGWNAARDRLWQIDLWRRSGLGELSAALGSAYVAQDRAIRLFIYRGNMDKEWAAYGPNAKRDTEAFVAGINAYVAAVKGNAAPMPQEFKLGGYEPAFWSADDVVRVRNHGVALAGVTSQVMRAQLLCKTDLRRAELLLKISPPWSPMIPEGLDLCSIPAAVLNQYRLAQKPVVFGQECQASVENLNLSEPSQGSNNWVIAPSRTTTGRPILANDPHRTYEVPSLRYLAHLVAPGLNVIGAGEPALPGIVIGHNEHIAFGITIFPIAQEELYVYETHPQNPHEYRYRGGWEPMRVIHESIAVRGSTNKQAVLKLTRHGPVVLEDRAQHRAYAVRATWLDTGGAPYFGSMRYLQAHTIEQFRAALKHWGEPGENHIYADKSGRIAWFPAGFTPIRRHSDGLLPLPGDGRYEWSGYLDRDLLPSEIDPARGYIATANQMNLPKDYPYGERRVSFSWVDDARFDRISEVLSGLPKSALRNSMELQNDTVTVPGRRLIGVLSTIPAWDRDPQLQDTIRWLKAWDAQVTAASAQAALFEVWVSRHLGSAVIAQAAPSVPRSSISGSAAAIVDLLEHPDERLGANPRKTRDDLMLGTLAAALEETQRLLGPDRSAWQWGQLATIVFEHPLSPLANDAQRTRMNVGPAPRGGDDSVVGMAAYRSTDFKVQVGASFRVVLDVGQWDHSVAVNTPGQSGDPSSPHYRDLFPLWLSGQYFPLLYSRSAIEQATEHRILLQPH